jgi:hypothetical protein
MSASYRQESARNQQLIAEAPWEAFNALNHPQFTQIPNRDVQTSPPGRLLNRDFTDSGIRSMWVQIKMIF